MLAGIRKFFLNLIYSWRFYTFGREQYQECMSNAFANNLQSLRQGNLLVAIFAVPCGLIPIFSENGNYIDALLYLAAAVIALILYFFTNYVMQQINVNNHRIYLLISLFYANLMLFGIYFSIWADPSKPASLVLCFFIFSLLLYINPPQFNLLLTLTAIAVFIVSTIIVKEYNIWIYDVIYVIIAGSLGLFFTWHISKLRLGLELSANELEDERNKYVDQSITDELTQLRNRRDFMHTFQRYLSNYRTSDDWLCIALADIDFFKFYNDNYGHPQGDVCLRAIGDALNWLRDDLGVYVARVGGEEFAVIWFEKDSSHVDKVINQWMETIKNLKIPHEKSKVSDFVTMSIGVYKARCGLNHDSQVLYDLADKALYAAKGGGRNCAIITGDDIKQYKITLPN